MNNPQMLTLFSLAQFDTLPKVMAGQRSCHRIFNTSPAVEVFLLCSMLR